MPRKRSSLTYLDVYEDWLSMCAFEKEVMLRSTIDTDATPHEPFTRDRFVVAWLIGLACLFTASAFLSYGWPR